MNKKTKIIVSFVVAIGALFTVIRIVLMAESYINYSSQLRHFWSSTECIADLTTDEQAELLAAFNVVIPEEETEAYISAFGKYESDEYFYTYFIEFDSVQSYQAFYFSNAHRIGENGLTGLSDNQMLSLTENQMENGYFSEPTDGKTDYFLTYSEVIHLQFDDKKLHIAELYEEYANRRK